MMSTKQKDLLFGVVIGGLVGAATVLLLAPNNGKKLKRDAEHLFKAAKRQKAKRRERPIDVEFSNQESNGTAPVGTKRKADHSKRQSTVNNIIKN